MYSTTIYLRVVRVKLLNYVSLLFVTGSRKNGAGLAKINFIPKKASTKFKYCLRKI